MQESLEAVSDLLNIACTVLLILSFAYSVQSTQIVASSSVLPPNTTITATVVQTSSCTTISASATTRTQCMNYVNIPQPLTERENLTGKVTRHTYVVLAESTKYWADTLGYVGLGSGILGIPSKAYFWWKRNRQRAVSFFRKLKNSSCILLRRLL